MAFPLSDVEVEIGPFWEPTTPPEEHKAPISQHPKISVMVNNALDELNDSKGSSLQAIKKYLAMKYEVDVEKQNLRIKKYLKKSVDEGSVIQVSGKGASGSFKLKKKSLREAVNPTKPKAVKKDKKPLSPNSATTTKKKLYTAETKSTKRKNDNESKNEKVKKPKPDKVTKSTDTQPKITNEIKEQKPKAVPEKKAKSKSKVSQDVSDGTAKLKTKAKSKSKVSEESSGDTGKPKTSKKSH